MEDLLCFCVMSAPPIHVSRCSFLGGKQALTLSLFEIYREVGIALWLCVSMTTEFVGRLAGANIHEPGIGAEHHNHFSYLVHLIRQKFGIMISSPLHLSSQ